MAWIANNGILFGILAVEIGEHRRQLHILKPDIHHQMITQGHVRVHFDRLSFLLVSTNPDCDIDLGLPPTITALFGNAVESYNCEAQKTVRPRKFSKRSGSAPWSERQVDMVVCM